MKTDIRLVAQTPENIKSVLRQAGLSQQACAQSSGVPAETIVGAIFADHPMDVEDWKRVLRVCQKRIDTFVEHLK